MAAEAARNADFDVVAAALRWWADGGFTERWGPTSSLTGGGAIAMAEELLATRLGAPALLVPSGSSSIRLGLRALTPTRDGAVWLSPRTWDGSAAIVEAAGLRRVDDPLSAQTHLVRTGDSAVASEAAVARVVDAADASPADYGRLAADDTWQALTLSFGPGKSIDAGEGGALLLRDRSLFERVVAATQHPIRRRLAGLGGTPMGLMPMERVHPVAALIVAYRICTDSRHPSTDW